MSSDAPIDAERYPTLTEHGRQMMAFLREHPNAPRFRNESGNRLLSDDVKRVREIEREMLALDASWPRDREPEWLNQFLIRALEGVPHYRNYGSPPRRLADLPTISRAELSRDIAQFVPDAVAADRLINFRTSGTTGHPLLLASHPVVAASYLTFHKRALRRFGVELRAKRGEVGVVLLGLQRKCFTYVSVTPTMDEAGLAKINLHPDDWRDPADRVRYLEALAPEVITGDPISFAELLRLEANVRPRALLSTSMALLPGLRQQLEAQFGCPVLDLYSLNEAGPIAVADPSAGGHVVLQPHMFIEIVDAYGQPVPEGERGEITLTGGFNFCLPLVRYRTGDFASLKFFGPEPVLVQLEGRPPVRFRTTAGDWINNIEITHALRGFAIPQCTVHQAKDGTLRMALNRGPSDVPAIRQALLLLFGAEQRLEIDETAMFDGKVVQYTSELIESA
ncbi:MAG: AMP-binding protein [Opitutaceae bacterium]